MADREPLTERQVSVVREARSKAFTLYEGVEVAHRSCGIALAETFDLPTGAYQSLRRGGITGMGVCGAIRAGEQILGEILGDPDPAGPVTGALRAAVIWYQDEVQKRIDRRASPDFICDHLTRPLGEFHGAARKRFCTDLAAEIAQLTAEALILFAPEDAPGLKISPIAGQTRPEPQETP